MGGDGIGLDSLSRVSFSGHETFPFRYAWLKKGINAVSEDSRAFYSDRAMIRLGVGKNMVRSIRHWCEVAGLIEGEARISNNRGRILTPTQLGKLIFADDGCDPFLEDPATLWLIHWRIASNKQRAATWFWTFNCWNGSEFTKLKLMTEITTFAQVSGWDRLSQNSLKRDVDCFIRTYVPSRQSKTLLLEDTLDCPLTELNLITDLEDGQTYKFNRGPQGSLPNGIFGFTLVEFWRAHAVERETLAFEEIAYAPGSPGRIFKLDEDSLFMRLERLEELTSGSLTYDETAGIKQVYRRKKINGYELLEAYYQGDSRKTRVVGGLR